MTDTNHRAPSRNKPWRLCAALGVLIVLLGVSACGGKSGGSVQPDPKTAASELSAGLQAQSAGKLDEATAHYNEALKYDPKNKYAIYDLAIIDVAHFNYGEAEQKYQVVLAIDPAYDPALFNLAILENAQGNDKGAIALYQRAIVAAPKDAAAHLNLGLLLRANGQKAAGDAEVKNALALNPKLRDPAAPVGPAKSPSAPSRASPSPT